MVVLHELHVHAGRLELGAGLLTLVWIFFATRSLAISLVFFAVAQMGLVFLAGTLVLGALFTASAIAHAAEQAYRSSKAPLNSVEGYVRQVLGWREYVWGIYWLEGPAYASLNELAATVAVRDSAGIDAALSVVATGPGRSVRYCDSSDHSIAPGWAPRAMRIPISCVRRLTT